MPDALRRLRSATTQMAIRQVITASGGLPIGLQGSVARSLVALVGGIPMLRRKVRENMRLALDQDVPDAVVRRYFHHVGWLVSHSLAAFHRGLAATSVPEEVRLDDSVRLLDEAVAEGRGVVLTAPHWVGHELIAAMINRRHPMAMIVRPAGTPERTARKLKWYDALGVETVMRAAGAPGINDAVAYARVLKSGKLLAITPDILAEPGQGVETSIFGRTASIHAGAFTLAALARAPIVRVAGRWQPESVVVGFDRAAAAPDAGSRDVAIRSAAQDWCGWFEAKLRESPENWLFWLDKRWSRFLRMAPRAARAA